MDTRPLLPVLLIVAFSKAHAEPFRVERVDADGPSMTYVSLRGGMSSLLSNGARPQVCLDVAPVRFFSLEVCGNGSTLLHQDAQPAVMHLRGKIPFRNFRQRLGWVQLLATAGIAELQVGADQPGLFFSSTGPDGVETAGPEAGVAARWQVPLLGSGLEALMEANFSLAYLSQAPNLTVPQGVVLPSLELTVGVGF